MVSIVPICTVSIRLLPQATMKWRGMPPVIAARRGIIVEMFVSIWEDKGVSANYRYNDVIMSAMASQITSLTIVY